MTDSNPFLVDAFLVNHDKYAARKKEIRNLLLELAEIALCLRIDEKELKQYGFVYADHRKIYPWDSSDDDLLEDVDHWMKTYVRNNHNHRRSDEYGLEEYATKIWDAMYTNFEIEGLTYNDVVDPKHPMIRQKMSGQVNLNPNTSKILTSRPDAPPFQFPGRTTLCDAIKKKINLIISQNVPDSENSAQLIEEYKNETLAAKAIIKMKDQKIRQLQTEIATIQKDRQLEILHDSEVKKELIKCQQEENLLKQQIKELTTKNAELPILRKEIEDAHQSFAAMESANQELQDKIQELEAENKKLKRGRDFVHHGEPVLDYGTPPHHRHQGHGRGSGSPYTTIDPNPVVEDSKKKMKKRWEAMKKELEREGYTNIH